MDTLYMATFVALRLDLINNLKRCWAGANGADNRTVEKLANSIAIVLLELSPHTEAGSTTAIYADAKSIAMDVVASSMRYTSVGRTGSTLAARA